MTNIRVLVVCVVLLLLPLDLSAQQNAQERAARLRVQLTDIQAQQTDFQTRLAQLDEDIKPQNTERSLAGVGSVHPEELREARRRQLEIQRKGLQSQLDSLASSRARLEGAIAVADAESYRQTVGPHPNTISKPTGKSIKHSHRQKHPWKRRATK